MPKFKRKTAKELYEDLKDYDVVITNDSSLSDMINLEVDEPRLNSFSYTPRQILKKNYGDLLDEDYLIISRLKNRLKKPYKILHSKFVKTIKAIESNEEFDRGFFDLICDFNNFYSVSFNLSEDDVQDLYSFLGKEDPKIAVIDFEMFNEFDKKVLPKDFDCIDLFTEGYFEIENNLVFENDLAIARYLADSFLASKKNIDYNSISIVIDFESDIYKYLIYELKRNEIPIKERSNFIDGKNINLCLQLYKIVLNVDTVKIKDILFFLQRFDVSFVWDDQNIFLKNAASKALKAFYHDLKSLRTKDLSSLIEFLSVDDLDFIEFISQGNLLDKKISFSNFNDLNYYFKNLNQKIFSDAQGILFVDFKNVRSISRDIHFFIDINSSLDVEFDLFSRLVQTDGEKFFLFPKLKNGEKNSPHVFFSKLLGKKCEEVLDLGETQNVHYARKDLSVKDKNVIEEDSEKNSKAKKEIIKKISSSKLSSYYKCPKRFFFDKYIKTPENFYMLRGTLVHNFAEMYLNDSVFCLQNREKIIDRMTDFLCDYGVKGKDLIKSEMQFYVSILEKFFETLDTSKTAKIYDKKSLDAKKAMSFMSRNILADEFGVKISNPNCEFYFDFLKTLGFIDYIDNVDHIVDYKIKAKPYSLLKDIHPKFMADDADFQPLVYLRYLKEYSKNPIFSYLFLKTDLTKKMYSKDFSVEIMNVRYIDSYFIDFLKDNEEAKNLFYSDFGDLEFEFEDLLSYYTDYYQEVISELKSKKKQINLNLNVGARLDTRDVEFEIKSFKKSNLDGFERYLKNKFPYDDKRLNKLIKYFKNYRFENKTKKTIFFYKEDMEFFEDLLKSSLNKINSDYLSKFHANPLDDKLCRRCPFLTFCAGVFDE